MQVIGYVRVSTDEQVRAGVSLVAQAAKIDAYATVKEWTLREMIRDAGVSAKTLHRPGLARLLALVRGREVDVVVVAKLDRLSRRVRDVYDLVELFEKKGVALVSLHESLDATTATGRAMMGLLAVMSQLERELIGERTQVAMQHLKAVGRVYCRPRFSATGADAPTLAHMHALRAAGATYQAIAEDLTAAGIPTVRGGRWQAATVLGILRRYPPCIERQAAL
jgi:site-specific DNA recombinase